MKRVALAFPLGVDHLAEVAYGIRRFADAANWQFLTNPERHRLEIRDLKGWDGDGIIAQINTEAEAEIIQNLGIPCVNISGVLESSPVPRVRADYFSMGKKAAEFFLKKGFYSRTSGVFFFLLLSDFFKKTQRINKNLFFSMQFL